MNLLLHRFSSQEEYTLGLLFQLTPPSVPIFDCFTLEDQFNEPKIFGETRIPEGRYEIKLRTEGGLHQKYGDRFPWHKGMLWLQDVPDFEWVYIHVGNDDDDTDGCILVGEGQNLRGSLSNSVPAYTRLYNKMVGSIGAGDKVFIEIEDFA